MSRLALSLTAALALLSSASLVLAQSADQVSQEQLTLSAGIPGECSTQCATWLSTLAGCPGPADATYSTCVCAADFQSNFADCSACFVQVADRNAATAQSAATDLTNYCSTAGADVSSSSSTTTSSAVTETSSTETSTSTTSSTTTTPPMNVATSSSSSSSSATDSSTSSEASVRTLTQVAPNADWPTQTKSSNVFTGGAATLSVGKSTGAVAAGLLGVVAGGMMLF